MSEHSGTTDGRTVFRRLNLLGCEYRSDLIGFDYMRRWVLRAPSGTARLHHLLRSDDDAHFHDHPMDFRSLILMGGYEEHRPGKAPWRYLPGDIVTRKAEDLHYLKLIGPTAWTLVVSGPMRRQWGFQREDGWIIAGKYDEWKKSKGYP